MFDSSYPIFDRAYPCYTALPLTLLPHDMRLPTSLCSYPCFRSILYHLPVLCSVLGPCTGTYVPLFVFPFAVHLHGGSCCFVTSVSPVMSFTTHDTSTPSLCLASMYARRPLTFYRSHVLSYFLRASHSNSSFRCFRLMVHSPSCCCLRTITERPSPFTLSSAALFSRRLCSFLNFSACFPLRSPGLIFSCDEKSRIFFPGIENSFCELRTVAFRRFHVRFSRYSRPSGE